MGIAKRLLAQQGARGYTASRSGFRMKVETKEVEMAMKELGRRSRDRAKLRRAAMPAARIVKRKESTRPVPKWLVTPSASKSMRVQKGLKKERSYLGKATIVSGNLRRSAIIVRNLKKSTGVIVGHQWGDITGGMVVGSSKKTARGFYGHMVDGGTGKRQTKSGKNRGSIKPQRYVEKILQMVGDEALRLLEQETLKLIQKEAKSVGLK